MSVASSKDLNEQPANERPAAGSADFTIGQSPSTDPFAKLAKWYDVLHDDKDYDRDAKIYAKHLNAWPGDCVIEWGCGTGEFTRRFADRGWKVTGCDSSLSMLAIAAKKKVADYAIKPRLLEGTLGVSSWSELKSVLFACAPFAVLSYAAISNKNLLRCLRDVRKYMHRGGRFVFDILHAAAAVGCLRTAEQKSHETPQFHLLELRRKTFRPATCIVEIESTVVVTRKADNIIVDRIETAHLMRAFSPPELRLALEQCGFKVLDIFNPWSERAADEGCQIGADDFYLMVVAEVV